MRYPEHQHRRRASTTMWKPLYSALCPLLAAACGDTHQPPAGRPDPWSDAQEELFQTREVIRFVDEQHRLELARLHALGVAPTEQQPAPQREQEQPQR